MIEVNQVSLHYFSPQSEMRTLKDVSFHIEPGEFVSIVGPSGCGKSSLLSLIAGLTKPTSGEIKLFGNVVNSVSKRVGYMLQHDHLFEWRDVLHNVLLGAEIQRLPPREAKRKAERLLARYGLIEFSQRKPRELSGGMRQRVALIRTLMLDPDILILDEPFSALDFQTRLAISEEVSGIMRSEQKTVCLVTHDIGEAISMSDRVIVLSKRPATVKAVHIIRFAGSRPNPIEARQRPEFNDYFRMLWEELDVHVSS